MKLSEKDAKLFYDTMMPLLSYANDVLEVVEHKKFENPESEDLIGQLAQIRDALWENEDVYFDYIEVAEENDLATERQIDLLESWFFRHEGTFMVAEHKKEHSILVDLQNQLIFGVKGADMALSDVFPKDKLPILVETTLMPFEGEIVTDGLLCSYSSEMVESSRKKFSKDLKKMQKENEVVTDLMDIYDTEKLDEVMKQLIAEMEEEEKALGKTQKVSTNQKKTKPAKSNSSKKANSRKAYELKISIVGSKPIIWRKVIVPARYTFEELHEVIQRVMDWGNYHLYEFECRSQGIRIIDEEMDDLGDLFEDDCTHSIHTEIGELLECGKPFVYTYDFGDNWEHKIELTQVVDSYLFDYPQLLKFKGDHLPEDCGGIDGYYHLLKVLADPDDPEYEMLSEWFLGKDAYEVDLEMINEDLQEEFS